MAGHFKLLRHCPVQRAWELQLMRARELQLSGALLPPVRLPLMRVGRCWSSHSDLGLTSSCRDKQQQLQ